MSQILTLTLNPVLDRILYVENFDFKHITRIDNALESSGGKGLNVSKALKKLGIQSQAIGVFGGLIGQKVTSLIEKENLNYYPIHINGETRTNTAVYSTNTLERIKLDEKGPRITDIEKQKILSTIKQLAIEDQIWVISGSLPQGLNHDFYVEITNLLNTVGVKTIVDASGEALKQIVKTKPFLIKPNDEECEELLGINIETIEDGKNAVIELLNMGVQNVALSLGSLGLILGNNTQIIHASAPIVAVKKTVGAGDGLMAGLVYAMINKLSFEEMAKWGVSVGTLSTTFENLEYGAKEDTIELQSQINITVL
jgi:1-phosphofructokinase